MLEFNPFKQDLIKAGYLLEMQSGRLLLVNYNNRDILGACSSDGLYFDICNLDDELYCKWRCDRVNKIFGRTFNGFINDCSINDRELLWERHTYEIGQIFIIPNMVVKSNIEDCYKTTKYENVKATITTIYHSLENGDGYWLSFDGNHILVKKEYLDHLKKVS